MSEVVYQRVPISSLRMLGAVPHRVMFFGGVLQGMAAAAWWLADLMARYLPVYRGARADGRPG